MDALKLSPQVPADFPQVPAENPLVTKSPQAPQVSAESPHVPTESPQVRGFPQVPAQVYALFPSSFVVSSSSLIIIRKGTHVIILLSLCSFLEFLTDSQR